MVAASAVRVFMPRECLEEDSGLLIGCVDKVHMVLCITGLLHQPNYHREQLQRNLENCTWGMIGLWNNLTSSDEAERLTDSLTGSSDFILRVSRNSDQQLQAQSKAFGLTTNIIVILFESRQFISSVLVDANVTSLYEGRKSNLEIVSHCFKLHRQCIDNEVKLNAIETRISLHDFTRRRKSVVRIIAEFMLDRLVIVTMLFTNFCCHLFSFFRYVHFLVINVLIVVVFGEMMLV